MDRDLTDEVLLILGFEKTDEGFTKDKVPIYKNNCSGGYYGEMRKGFVFKKTVSVPLKTKEEVDLYMTGSKDFYVTIDHDMYGDFTFSVNAADAKQARKIVTRYLETHRKQCGWPEEEETFTDVIEETTIRAEAPGKNTPTARKDISDKEVQELLA
jgi:hypothetical protein